MIPTARAIGLSVKQHLPQADHSKGPILDVLRSALPGHGIVLEIGSGTGQHAIHFARAFPGLQWQPSDYDQVSVASIESYRRDACLPNVREPLLLEARQRVWGHGALDGVLGINLVHVTSWSVCRGLFDGARRHLRPHGVLFVYGPFTEGGGFKTPEHEQIDGLLRARNPAWGLRDVEAVVALGRLRGLVIEQVVGMPNGDLGLVFRRGLDH